MQPSPFSSPAKMSVLFSPSLPTFFTKVYVRIRTLQSAFIHFLPVIHMMGFYEFALCFNPCFRGTRLPSGDIVDLVGSPLELTMPK